MITITHIKNGELIFNKGDFIENNEKYDKYKILKNDIILSLTGKKPNLVNVALNKTNVQLYLNQRCAILRNFEKINIYYFLGIFDGFLFEHINKYIGNGSNQENVSLTDILNLQIPVPKSAKKIQKWVDKISEPYDKMNDSNERIKEFELEIKEKIQDITDNEECDEVELGSIVNFTAGKFKSSDCKKSGLFPFFNGKSVQPDGYSDNYCFDCDACIILIKDGGAGVGKYGDQIGLGNVFLVSGKCGFTSHQVALTITNKSIDIRYLFYVLKTHKNNIMDLANYSTGLGTITRTDLHP